MIASRGARAKGRQQQRGRMSSSSSTLWPAPSSAFYARVMGVGMIGLSVACSEGSDTPPIGGGGSGSGSGGSSGMTGTAGSGSGSSGAGGSAGAQGSAGSGPTAPGQVYDFGSSLEGFAINYYCTGPAPNAACAAPLAPPAPAGDAGTAADATAPVEPAPANDFYTLVQDSTVGEANPGSAKLSLNFTAGTQSLNFAINYGSLTVPGIDLTGKTVRAQVRIEPGAPPTTYAKMYVKTGSDYYYADSGQVTLVPSSWVTLSFAAGGTPAYPVPTNPAQYLLGDVREIGLEIAATGIAAAATAEIHIDTVSY